MTQEELAREVADLRARLVVSEEALAEHKRVQSKDKAVCKGEMAQLEEARKTLSLANMIVENSPAVLFRRESNKDAKLVYVSENISQWGYEAQNFLSGINTYKDVIHPDDYDRVGEELLHYKEKNVEEYRQEYRIVTMDGITRWVSDETSVVRDDEGVPLYNQGVLLDITRRKVVEEALIASEFKFRRTIESAGEGYVLVGSDLTILEANEAYCRMIGYECEEMIGKSLFDFATLEYRQFLLSNRNRLRKQEYRRFEGALVHKDGHVVPILVNSNTLCDVDGEFIGNVAFVADLTEQRKALELAGEVQKSLQPDTSPSISGLDVAGSSIASEIAGGDYFDYFEDLTSNNSSLSIAVGDISGHGVDAALLMTTARGFLRMRAAQPGSPAQIVTEMNRHLANDLYGSGRFMTMFYLNLNTENNRAQWVRAGHDPAMIYCPVLDTFTELGTTDSGLPLGVIHESEYGEYDNEMHPGQIIAIGTDGIWEARNPEGEMFGKERFKAVVRDNAISPAQDILDAVFDAVREFSQGARPDDDITLVIVKYGVIDE